MHTVIIAGQSNAVGLAEAFEQKFTELTGLSCHVMQAERMGSALLHGATEDPSVNWWGDPEMDPLYTLLRRIEETKDIACLWWIQGENEALNGLDHRNPDETNPNTLEGEYRAALVQLRDRCAAKGDPFVPFMISPVSGRYTGYRFTRAILSAQYRQSREVGFILGPEYYDLPCGDDLVHLTDAGKWVFGTRGAEAVAKLMGHA